MVKKTKLEKTMFVKDNLLHALLDPTVDTSSIYLLLLYILYLKNVEKIGELNVNQSS